MKILETQNAVLTNIEFYRFVKEREAILSSRSRNKATRRRGPPNSEANSDKLIREVMAYLTTAPGPLSQTPLPFGPDAIPRLLEKLASYDLTKGELLMIFNLRPASSAALNACIAEYEERFYEEQGQELIDIIAEVLGQFPSTSDDAPAEGDAMQSVESSA